MCAGDGSTHGQAELLNREAEWDVPLGGRSTGGAGWDSALPGKDPLPFWGSR